LIGSAIMTDVEQLLAMEEIKALKARYFRCVDTKDWDGFAAVFADDAAFEVSEADWNMEGRAAIVETVRSRLHEAVTVHHGHCPEITVTSPTAAEGIWAMEDLLRWDRRSASDKAALHGYGHYHETYRKIDGSWRIQSMKLTRLRVDITEWGDPS